MQKKKSLLTIAGFDPTGGAGILTDAAVFRTLGFHPLAVLTSVAVQGGSGVRSVRPLPEPFIDKELEIAFEEFQPAAVKIGMLYSPEAVNMVADFLTERSIPIVLDPVFSASGGGELLLLSALPLLEERLIPLCRIVTPNLDEAIHFLNLETIDPDQIEEAATELSQRWDCSVLLKGGHLNGDPVDVLAIEGTCEKFPHHRLQKGVRLRGTGCALSAAIAAELGDGKALKKAVSEGLRFVREAIQEAYSAGRMGEIGFLGFGGPQSK